MRTSQKYLSFVFIFQAFFWMSNGTQVPVSALGVIRWLRHSSCFGVSSQNNKRSVNPIRHSGDLRDILVSSVLGGWWQCSEGSRWSLCPGYRLLGDPLKPAGVGRAPSCPQGIVTKSYWHTVTTKGYCKTVMAHRWPEWWKLTRTRHVEGIDASDHQSVQGNGLIEHCAQASLSDDCLQLSSKGRTH